MNIDKFKKEDGYYDEDGDVVISLGKVLEVYTKKKSPFIGL